MPPANTCSTRPSTAAALPRRPCALSTRQIRAKMLKNHQRQWDREIPSRNYAVRCLSLPAVVDAHADNQVLAVLVVPAVDAILLAAAAAAAAFPQFPADADVLVHSPAAAAADVEIEKLTLGL